MSMAKIHTLVSWIGATDLNAASGNVEGEAFGPTAATLQAEAFDAVELLYDYPEYQVKPFLGWLPKLESGSPPILMY